MQLESQIKYYLSHGANPNKYNSLGQDYRMIIRQTFEEYIDEYNALGAVDEIVLGKPDKPKGIWDKIKGGSELLSRPIFTIFLISNHE